MGARALLGDIIRLKSPMWDSISLPVFRRNLSVGWMLLTEMLDWLGIANREVVQGAETKKDVN